MRPEYSGSAPSSIAADTPLEAPAHPDRYDVRSNHARQSLNTVGIVASAADVGGAEDPVPPLSGRGRGSPRRSGREAWEDLVPALRRLDSRLKAAVATLKAECSSDLAADPFLGLYITDQQVEWYLSKAPGTPSFTAHEAVSDEPDHLAALFWLRQCFSLSTFDLEVMVIALAPELDLRYERLYAYLQNDVSRRRPTVDLALTLLCASPEERTSRRGHFLSGGSLATHGLLSLITEPGLAEPPLLARVLKLDDQIVSWMLGETDLDGRLASFCGWLPAGASTIDAAREIDLVAMMMQADATATPLRLSFEGPPGAGQKDLVRRLAAGINAPVLEADVSLIREERADFVASIALLFRTARLHHALLLLSGMDALAGDDRAPNRRRIAAALTAHPGVVVVTGEHRWASSSEAPLALINVPFGLPTFADRRSAWQASLARRDAWLDATGLDTLANRFRLFPGQIDAAVVTAHQIASGRSDSATTPVLGDLLASARAQSGRVLRHLARQVEPRYGWADIILPPDALAQLHEMCDQATHRHTVYSDWGFEARMSLGRGLTALFCGSPGTGKTMAAEVIASELSLDLYRIDLSQVVSKYIGDTEKNLCQIFAEAEGANAILLFDEADTLFGKRSQVKDAHDRYANIEVGYLLQKIEEFDGIAIMATNLRANLDDAFLRRIKFSIEFPFPDEPQRYRLWSRHLHGGAPTAPDVDLGFLAARFRLSGANIKNIVVNAAFLAAAAHESISMKELILATRREFQKLGRACMAAEFEPYFALVNPEGRA